MASPEPLQRVEHHSEKNSSVSLSQRATSYDLEDIWRELDAGLGAIYLYRAPKLSANRFRELRMVAYNFHRMFTKIGIVDKRRKAVFTSGFSLGPNSNVPTLELFSRLECFLSEQTRNLMEIMMPLRDDSLLDEYSRLWSSYTDSSATGAKIFDYLSSSLTAQRSSGDAAASSSVHHSTGKNNKEDKNSHFGFYSLALFVWKKEVVEKLFRSLIPAALSHIDQSRFSEKPLNLDYIRSVVHSYVAAGTHEKEAFEREQSNAEGVFVAEVFKTLSSVVQSPLYRELFFKPLLLVTHNRYIEWSEAFMKERGVVEYMAEAQSRLSMEEARCSEDGKTGCLTTCSLEPLRKVCIDAMIKNQLSRFYEEFNALFIAENVENLKRMYDLCGLVAKSHEKLKELLSASIAGIGRVTINKIAERAMKDPKLFVNTILQLHKAYTKLVLVSFRTDNEFVATMEMAFTEFVANNDITEGGKAEAKSARIVATYCDLLLRKNVAPTQRDEGLGKAIITYKYIRDKDNFNDLYQKLLCKRLMYAFTAGMEQERGMLLRLKENFHNTKTLTNILDDFEKSEKQMEDFKASSNALSVDFTVVVFSNNAWPFPDAPLFNLPPELIECVDAFQNYYVKKHSGRKLSWVPQAARGELTSTKETFDKQYNFQCTTQQMSVLMLFNQRPSYTQSEVAEQLELTLSQVLPALIGAGLLTNGGKENKKLQLNASFSSEKTTVNLVRAATATAASNRKREDTELSRRRKDVFRECVLQAAIVGALKARKKMKHEEMVAEVKGRLVGRFEPSMNMFKRCIEQLIMRDFLRRSIEDKQTYEFVAASSQG